MRYSDECTSFCCSGFLNYSESCDKCKIEYEEYTITLNENRCREMTEEWTNE